MRHPKVVRYLKDLMAAKVMYPVDPKTCVLQVEEAMVNQLAYDLEGRLDMPTDCVFMDVLGTGVSFKRGNRRLDVVVRMNDVSWVEAKNLTHSATSITPYNASHEQIIDTVHSVLEELDRLTHS